MPQKYGISHGTLAYWIKNCLTLNQNPKLWAENDELKKLRERIEELEFVKTFNKIVIADFEHITGASFKSICLKH
jgi:hypothetical protein